MKLITYLLIAGSIVIIVYSTAIMTDESIVPGLWVAAIGALSLVLNINTLIELYTKNT